ncbi:MAG: endo-1,4-beta-xylanase, partial [Acidimicrobiaceae bacterium]|nr:endo-1,4-beta-xylanase [Acidimicrobiaceae bacterium]
FTLTDAFAEYAERHDMRLRGHALVWGRGGRPHNLESTLRASSDQRKTLLRLMREHISTVAARYRGKVAVWDVVNEPMAYSGTGLDKNVFFETLGEEYVVESFRLARAADPEAELVLNEQISWNEYDGRSASEFVDFVRRLLDVETPIDGIGLQGHMLMGTPDPVALDRFLRRIEDLGLFIEITEMDMRIGLFADEQDPLGAQADSYNMLAEVFAAVPAVRGVMFWGAADSHTWLDSFPPFDAASPNQPLLFDRDLKPKPAYYAFMAGLASRQPIGATP